MPYYDDDYDSVLRDSYDEWMRIIDVQDPYDLIDDYDAIDDNLDELCDDCLEEIEKFSPETLDKPFDEGYN